MECPVQTGENADLLLAYCARRLDPATAAVLERHMEHCEACRAFGEGQRTVWSALDVWEALPVAQDFDRRLYARIAEEGYGGVWSRWLRPWLPLNFRGALSLAAASAVVLVAFLVQSPRSAPGPAEVEVVDAEQVESALDDLDMLRQVNLVPRAEAAPGPVM
jgi:anti-sigma factor RsiW